MDKTIRRGDIYYADLNPVVGSEQGGVRPVLVISNDKGNRYSPAVIVAAITSSRTKRSLPTHSNLDGVEGLPANSVVLLEQLRTIDKRRLQKWVTQLDSGRMGEVDVSLSISVGLKAALPAGREAQKEGK